MKRTLKIWMCVLGCAAAYGPAPVWAGEDGRTEILIRKLVQRGILSEEDAREIEREVDEEAAWGVSSRPGGAPEAARAAKGGGWPDKVKWSGDLRLRHETQRREPATDRNRERFRLRFGFIAQPWDPLEIGARLSTGATGDPVSPMQSFGSTFDRKPILLDRAYARYTPWEWLSAVGGKMENPFHTVSETVWDADVAPEGGALQLRFPGEAPVKPFGNFGAFQVSELSGDSGDPAVFGAQGGAQVKLPGGFSWKPSVAYYDFTAIQGSSTANVTNSPAGNSTVTEGAAAKFRDDFNLVALASTLSLPPVLKQPVSLFGDWTHNEAAQDDAGAWAAGLEVGKVTEKFGSWKTSYLYKRVEPDAAFGAITDSDFGGGGTNHKGHRMGVQMGLNKWASLGATYIRTDEVEGSQNRVDTFQADLQLKY